MWVSLNTYLTSNDKNINKRKMIKTIIVEDDPNDVKTLVDSLSRYEEIEILCICKNSTEIGRAHV